MKRGLILGAICLLLKKIAVSKKRTVFDTTLTEILIIPEEHRSLNNYCSSYVCAKSRNSRSL